MNEELQNLTCPYHGEANLTYVCEHLLENSEQPWFGGEPHADDPWPDAWCTVCNDAYQAQGEWNDHNEDSISIKLLCHGCYEERRPLQK